MTSGQVISSYFLKFCKQEETLGLINLKILDICVQLQWLENPCVCKFPWSLLLGTCYSQRLQNYRRISEAKSRKGTYKLQPYVCNDKTCVVKLTHHNHLSSAKPMHILCIIKSELQSIIVHNFPACPQVSQSFLVAYNREGYLSPGYLTLGL